MCWLFTGEAVPGSADKGSPGLGHGRNIVQCGMTRVRRSHKNPVTRDTTMGRFTVNRPIVVHAPPA